VSKGVISALELVGAVVLAVYGQYQLAASLAAAALGTEHAARAEIAARNAYNASLRDRYAMVRSSTAARQLVFGRCRVSGPIFFGASYGNDNQHLTICVALAAHEVDAIETLMGRATSSRCRSTTRFPSRPPRRQSRSRRRPRAARSRRLHATAM
jgi:hypothetical protein